MKRFVFGISFIPFFLLQMIGCNNTPIRCELFDFNKLPVGFEFPEIMVFSSDSLISTFRKTDSIIKNPDTLCYLSVYTACDCESTYIVTYEDERKLVFVFTIIQNSNNLNEISLYSLQTSIYDSRETLPSNQEGYNKDFILKTPDNAKLNNLKFDKNLNWIEFQDSTGKIWKRVDL